MNFAKTSKAVQIAITGAAVAALAGCGSMFGDRSAASGSQASSRQATAPAASDDLVRRVQEQLRARGVSAGPVDGIWGPETQQGVQKFQRSQGLQATGQLNAPTLQALGITGPEGTRSGAAGTAAGTAAGASAQGASPSGAGSTMSSSDTPSFRTLDANNDGEISRAEAGADPRIQRNFDRADQDGNGRLSTQEFNRMLDMTDVPGQGAGSGR